jgi:hypothetical protein
VIDHTNTRGMCPDCGKSRGWNDGPPHECPMKEQMTTHFYRQRDWSLHTFGPGARTAGVLDHIRKELKEIEAEPTSLEEWIDVAILAFDGAWRAGHTPEKIAAAWLAKQGKNESRKWPDWRTVSPDQAIEHVR